MTILYSKNKTDIYNGQLEKARGNIFSPEAFFSKELITTIKFSFNLFQHPSLTRGSKVQRIVVSSVLRVDM